MNTRRSSLPLFVARMLRPLVNYLERHGQMTALADYQLTSRTGMTANTLAEYRRRHLITEAETVG